MHSAPSVTYPVGRSRFAGLLALLLWLAGCAATLLWWIQVQDGGWRRIVLLSVVAAAGACGAWAWRRSPVGHLAWDGDMWTLTTADGSGSGSIHVRVDLQFWLLLEWWPGGPSAWLWLELRRALYSPARREAPAAGPASAANP